MDALTCGKCALGAHLCQEEQTSALCASHLHLILHALIAGCKISKHRWPCSRDLQGTWRQVRSGPRHVSPF